MGCDRRGDGRSLITSFQGFTGTADASASDGGGGLGDAGSDGGGGPGDAGSDGGGGPGDAGADAPPHVIFITSKGYAGNLVKEADTLIEAGAFPGPDGGAFGPGDGLAAGDALCQHAATRAGLPGVFWALLNVISGADVFARLKDSDGPWALTDGTPVKTFDNVSVEGTLDEFAIYGWSHGLAKSNNRKAPLPVKYESSRQQGVRCPAPHLALRYWWIAGLLDTVLRPA